MFRPKTLLLLFLLLLSATWLFSSGIWKRAKASTAIEQPAQHALSSHSVDKIQSKAIEARKFVTEKGYNDEFCFLIDMSIGSGQDRFFIYDLKKDSLRKSGLVTHGRCNENWLEGRRYSNTVGGGCTSLGKYKIGNSYYGRFGLAFKLYGLDKTNDKAFQRFVVLHSHECVPETEAEGDICQSDGCPTVSPGFLQQLKPLISGSKKPVLLWIYD